jgi:subtilase family serine protease
MKRVLILGLAVLALLIFDSSAEAGRRKDRRAARKGGGGGIYAGAYQRNSGAGAYPVAKAGYTEAHAAPAAVIATANVDLTVAGIAVEDNALCVTVKNVGHAASPETRLEVVVAKPQAAELEAQNVRVLPLLPNQAVKIRFAMSPSAGSQVEALVDPDHSLAELSKENNVLRVMLVDSTVANEPPILSDDAT